MVKGSTMLVAFVVGWLVAITAAVLGPAIRLAQHSNKRRERRQ